jgi:predicted DNA-binding protein
MKGVVFVISNEKEIKETIRLNINIPRDKRIFEYLKKTKPQQKSAFIKEAIESYIAIIEAGKYKSPYLEDSIGEYENKFLKIINEDDEVNI